MKINQPAAKKPDIAFPKGCCFFLSALSAERKKKENTLRPLRLRGEIYSFVKTVFVQE
jgi:hypothetical protein